MINLVFDLDGTLADLYNVPKWLQKLRASDVTPYEQAEPLCDMLALRDALLSLEDVRIIVVSWGSMGASQEYMRQIRKAKIEWLHKWKFPFDELHIVKYGTSKYSTLQYKQYTSYLFDDSEQVRMKFEKSENCLAFDEKSIFKILEALQSG